MNDEPGSKGKWLVDKSSCGVEFQRGDPGLSVAFHSRKGSKATHSSAKGVP